MFDLRVEMCNLGVEKYNMKFFFQNTMPHIFHISQPRKGFDKHSIVNIMAAVLFCVYVSVRFHYSPSIHYYIRYSPIFQLFFAIYY
jgi:hypothetical protein